MSLRLPAKLHSAWQLSAAPRKGQRLDEPLSPRASDTHNGTITSFSPENRTFFTNCSLVFFCSSSSCSSTCPVQNS
ncbi:hypothetical protein PAMP_003320 [Pampus punctatissimus]